MDDIIRKAIEGRLASEGIDWVKLESFQIDRKAKTLTAGISLEGEPAPVAIDLDYAIEGDDILIKEATSSKPWMTKLAGVALAKHGARFPLPTGMKGKMVRMVL